MKKYKDTAITILIVVGLFAGFVYLAGKYGDVSADMDISRSETAKEGENFYDFGNIKMENGNVATRFSFKNTEANPITVQKAYTSCMCSTANVYKNGKKVAGPFGMPGHGSARANITIMPEETIEVEAIFDPTAHGPSGVGFIDRVIMLETDSASRPKLEFKFQAMVSR